MHVTLGDLLDDTGATNEAIEKYQLALNANPRSEAALNNLARLFQHSGQITQSIAAWNDYLKYYPKSPRCAAIRELIKGLRSESGKGSTGDTDYYADVTKKALIKWKTAVPIKVFIAPSEHVQGYKPEYSKYLADAFDQWTAEVPLLKWQRVESAKDADVVCHGVTKMPKGSGIENVEGGRSKAFTMPSDPHTIASSEILLETISEDGKNINDDTIKFICLHEVGHTLGLIGHSANPNLVCGLSFCTPSRRSG